MLNDFLYRLGIYYNIFSENDLSIVIYINTDDFNRREYLKIKN